MMKTEEFDGSISPEYYAPRLKVGGRLDIGLCTLWTKDEVLDRSVPPEVYGIRGPLFSLRGAEYIVRNVLLNPSLRTIVIAGGDANSSPDGLIALVNNGLGPKGEILGLNDERGKPTVYFDPQLPKEAVDLFRENIRIVDLRGEKKWSAVVKVINDISSLDSFDSVRRRYPESMPTANTLMSEGMGIRIERKSIADAWLDMLFHIRKFGTTKPTDKGRNIQELASLHIIVDEDPINILERIPGWLPLSRQDIESYLPVMLQAVPPSGVEMAYTYGAQLRNYEGLDQLAEIARLLTSEWFTKRAVATTWHLPNHLVDQVASAPCLTDLMFLVQNDKLLMYADFRSHDMYRAWLQNVYGLRLLQQEMALKTGIAIGKMEIRSNSAHLWQDIIPDADRLIDQRYSKLAHVWREDPRGNFLITIEQGHIKLVHVDISGNPTGKVFTSKDGQMLYKRAILDEALISFPDHAAYLAWEIGMAARAIAMGESYQQDKA